FGCTKNYRVFSTILYCSEILHATKMQPMWRTPIRFEWSHVARRKTGKPPGKARLRRQEIAAYVRRLQQTQGGKLREEIVPKAAEHFVVHVNTVWNALRASRPIHLTFTHSGRFE